MVRLARKSESAAGLRAALFGVCGLLTACQHEDTELDVEPVVLECTDELLRGTEQEGFVTTVRVYPDGDGPTALQYFHASEGRWFEPCRQISGDCKLVVDDRFFREAYTIGEGSTVVTEINRTTGQIIKTAYADGLGSTILADGVCSPIVEPQESEIRF
ncbi:MAG: hypothetical protein H6918_11520 [Sphingomonadaceae bacterium]|nr:hypothetical protein [Sphingomonadaceae bacterium]